MLSSFFGVMYRPVTRKVALDSLPSPLRGEGRGRSPFFFRSMFCFCCVPTGWACEISGTPSRRLRLLVGRAPRACGDRVRAAYAVFSFQPYTRGIFISFSRWWLGAVMVDA